MLRLYALFVQGLLYLMGDRRERVAIGEHDLVVHRLGPENGEPWLLLHGLGSTGFSWFPLLRTLRKDCRLVVPELSALGGTRGPVPSLGPRRGAPLLLELLDREGMTRDVTLAGLSLGGWIAVWMALLEPERFSRLLLLNAAGWADEDWDEIRRKVTLENLSDVGRFYDLMFHRTPLRFHFSRPGILKAFRSPAVLSVFDRLDESLLYDSEDLRGLRVPTGLVWAEEDGLFPPDVAWAMAEALPDLRYLSVIPECGHALHWDRPEALIRRVRELRRWMPARREPAGQRPPARAS